MVSAYIVKMYHTDDLRNLQFPYHAARRRMKLEKAEDYLLLPHEAITDINITTMPGM